MDSPYASLFSLTRPVVPTSTARQLLQFEEPASLPVPSAELLLRRPGTGRILHQFPRTVAPPWLSEPLRRHPSLNSRRSIETVPQPHSDC